MARTNVLEDQTISLYAKARGLKYDDVKQVKFVLEGADKGRTMSCTAEVTEHKWKKNEYAGEVVALAPVDDELFYDVTCYLEVPKGKKRRRKVGDLRIWREEIDLKVTEAATGKPAEKAACGITPGAKEAPDPVADVGGQVPIPVEFRETLKIAFKRPWFLNSWVEPSGVRREAKLDYRFKAAFVDHEPGAEVVQWVLRDADLGDDCGSKVTIEVTGADGEGRPDDKVYLRATSPDKPVFNDDQALDGKCKAEFEVDLGSKLLEGDKPAATLVAIGTTDACDDASITIVHRHIKAKLVYPSPDEHDQLVRKDPGDGPNCGTKIEVKVGADADAKAGDTIYLEVTDDKGATPYDAKLGKGLTASFDIDVGDTPGAIRTFEVGSTADCEDDKTRVRNVSFKAQLAYPPSKAKDHQQWVNLDTDATKPDQGNVMKVKVVSDTSDGGLPAENGDKVYLKASFDGKNNDRTPDADGHAKGAVHLFEATMQNGEATADLNVGHAGGDKVKIEVGFDKTYGDDKADVVTWRKLLYELCYPDNLQLDGDDLPAATTDWMKARLDKSFVVYEKMAAATYTLEAPYKYPASYVGKKGRDLAILGSWNSPGSFKSNDKRCVKLTVADDLYSGRGTTGTMRPKGLKRRSVTLRVTTVLGEYIFPKNMRAGGPSIFQAKWTARPDNRKPHPGRVGNRGDAKTGDIDTSWFEWVDIWKVKINFPEGSEPGSFVGKLSDTTCPVDLDVKLYTAYGILGSAGAGKQKLAFHDAHQAIGQTLLHELGHSMGQTVLPTGVRFITRVTPGVGAPTPVTQGDAYDEKGHVGSHCAQGLSGDEKKQVSYSGLSGTCIMFGEASPKDPPKQGDFCPECQKQITARKLTDLHSSWRFRPNKDI